MSYKFSKFKPVTAECLCEDDDNINVLDFFIMQSKKNGIKTLFKEFEKRGYIDNFRIIADGIKKKHAGISNSEV